MARIRGFGRPRSKYGNEKVISEGVRFDSKGELKRWGELQLWELAGGIKALRRQVKYDLMVPDRNGKPFLVESFVADYVYTEKGQLIIEDYKGFRTRDFIRKKKWMKNVLGLEVQEFRKR